MPDRETCSVKGRKIRILLVDDHPLLREGLVQLLASESDLTICGQVGDSSDAVEAIDRTRPDLIIADISLPGRDGIDLIKELKARYPKLLVLVFSMHDELVYAERALHAGAKGYVMKGEPPQELIQAIRRVLAGEIAVGKNMVSRLLHRAAGAGLAAANSAVDQLTDRELEVFRLIGQGHSRGRIAAQLHLSVKTVEAHRANIRRKLGLRDATELMQQAVQHVQFDEVGPSGKTPSKTRKSS